MPDAGTLRIDVPGTAITLEARFCQASAKGALALIAPPHPLYGGSIENPVVRALEVAFQTQGYATLAFNFRGTGESGGVQRGDMEEALSDLLAAARALPAPPLRVLRLLDAQLVRGFSGQLCAVAGDHDEYAPHADLSALFGRASDAKLELLSGVDHFFSGTQIERLRAVLPRLIG